MNPVLTMIAAAATTDALPPAGGIVAVGWVMLTIGAIFVILNQGSAFFQRQRGSPANEELKGSFDTVVQRVHALEKESAEAMVRRRAMHEKIEKAERTIREEVKRDAGELHEKINKVGIQVATLSAQSVAQGHQLTQITEAQNRQLAHIEGKLDRLIERKPA